MTDQAKTETQKTFKESAQGIVMVRKTAKGYSFFIPESVFIQADALDEAGK